MNGRERVNFWRIVELAQPQNQRAQGAMAIAAAVAAVLSALAFYRF